jgi:hypothetical protein
MTTTNDTAKIRELNDAFRQHFPANGKRYITDGIFALDSDDRDAILEKVRTFDSFTPDNDPHEEHDFGSIDHNGERISGKSTTTTPPASTAPKTPPTLQRRCASSPSCWPRNIDRGGGRAAEARPLLRYKSRTRAREFAA